MSPKEQKDIIFAHLDIEREAWIKARDQAARDDYMNKAFNDFERARMNRVDALLDALAELDLLGEFVVLKGPQNG